MVSIKEAHTYIKILDFLKKRWSPRAFHERPVEKDTLMRIFEAARWSASSRNEQPWRFILGRQGHGETFEKILSTLEESNKIWCKDAPVLVLLVAKRHFAYKNHPNQHALYDCGQAAAYLSVQAIHEGVYLHQMAGFSPEEACRLFNIPDNFIPVTAIAAGYLGNPDMLGDDLRESEMKARTRHELSTLVFGKEWGHSSDLFL